MEILFLGTGGGRFVTVRQLLATGGIIIKLNNTYIHLDPGPGALVRARQFNFNLSKVELLLVSHCHPDHYTDAEMVIEAMTQGGNRKKGFLITNQTCYYGMEEEGFRKVFSPYHLTCLEQSFVLDWDEELRIGGIKIKGTKTQHSEPKGLGFVIEGEKVLGYTGDGVYFEGQEDYFKGCDVLILNSLRPRGDSSYKHMNIDMAEELIKKAKPKLAILQHLGAKLLFGIAQAEARKIEKSTGIKTIAAKDGQRITL